MKIARGLLVLAVVAASGMFSWPEPRSERRSRTEQASEPVNSQPAWPPVFDDPNPDRRRAAAWELREQGDSALPIFFRLLRHGDSAQKILAARSLGHMKKGAAELLAALDVRDTELCLVFLKAVERIGKPEGDRWALPLLAHHVRDLRLAALRLLKAHDAEVVNAVADLIDPERGGEEDEWALEALGHAPGGLAQILAAFEHEALLQGAIEAVERMGPAAAPASSALVQVILDAELASEKELENFLEEPQCFGNGGIEQYYAADALAAIGESALPETVAMLGSELSGVRGHASTILAAMGDAALPALVTATHDSSPAIRAAATTALKAFAKDHPELLERLETLSRDSGQSVRLSALSSLSAYGRAATPTLLAALASTDEKELESALDSLRDTKANDPRLIAPIGRLLVHEEHTVQWSAADALGAMGTEVGEGISILAVALDKADHFLVMSITEALVAIGPITLPVLASRINLASASAQVAMIEVFVKLTASSAEVRAACERLLQSQHGMVRIRAAAFLAPFDAHRDVVLTMLRQGLAHKSSAIRKASAEGLGRMGAAAEPALPELIRLAVAEGERENNRVPLYDVLAAVGVADIPLLVNALAIDSWNLRFAASHALNKMGERAVPHLAACAPNLRPHTIPILRDAAKKVPKARAVLARWAEDPDAKIRFLALQALWKATFDARAVVPGLIALAPSDPRANYLLSKIGSRAYFALDDLRTLYAKTKQSHIAEAIKKIEQR